MPQFTDDATSPFATDEELEAAIAGLSDGVAEARLIVSATDYGATGDGATDDGTAIDAAISAVSAAGGGEVFFPTGVYLISSALSIPNFVSLRGQGADSAIIRCSGNHYAINFNPGNRTTVSGFSIDAASEQSSGGAFDFTNAVNNIRIDDIYLVNNLHTGFNIKPSVISGHYYISRVKWNGVTGCTNGVLLGDGTNLVAHVTFSNCLGAANTVTGMDNWWIQKNNTDTIRCDDLNFFRGTNGVLIGESATGTVSDSFWDNCLIDTMTDTGLTVAKCRGLNWTDGQIQTCAYGMNISSEALGFKARGGTVQNNDNSGVIVQASANHWSFDGVTVCDNNTTNGAFGQGFDIVGGTSNWSITNCEIGNNILLGTGHQKYGINLSSGASNDFRIDNNFFSGNETYTYTYTGATGGRQSVQGNLGMPTPVVTAAATITVPGYEVVSISGNTNITSVTAGTPGQRVTLIFSGTPTFTDGSNLKLAGNLVATADDTITLICDGTNWIEAGRSVN